MAEDRPPFVAREEDVAALKGFWEDAKSGQPRLVRLQSAFGGGRRAIAGEFLRTVATGEDAVVWRVTCLDQENGMQWLVRMYGSLVAALTQDVLRRGRIELALNGALTTQPKRVQSWYQEFISSLKEAKTDREKGAVQLRIPKDNPLVGLVEVTVGIARKFPIVLELQSPYVVHSVLLSMFLDALADEAKNSNAKILVILHDEPEDEVSKALHPMPLLDLYERRAADVRVHRIAPWGEAETKRYLESKGLATTNAARIAEIAKGRPGFIAELAEILVEKNLVEGDLSAISFKTLVPTTVNEGAIDVPTETPPEGQRKHATPQDAGRIGFFAALLGQAFPSALVADMGGWDRDSIDDMLDALEELFEEVQFTEEMGWIYKFKRGSWREGIIEQNDTEEGHDLARRVGLFMERVLVPRGYAFIGRTARVYAEHGAGPRAALMRSLALTNDAPDVWVLSYDLATYFDEIPWPDALRRTLYMNLLDRLVAGGTVEAAEKVHTDATEWATKKEDRELMAWLLYAGSRLDARRKDRYRATDRAKDALKLYAALKNDARQAEIHNHLASIELNDGNPAAALEEVEKALVLGHVDGPDGKKVVLPGILANAEFIKGLVDRNARKLADSAEHFRRANQIAGDAQMGPLALEAGYFYGEMLLAQNQVEQARDVLTRVVQIARALNNPIREHNASQLAAQAEGRLRRFAEALPHAQRALEISNKLGIQDALPIDLYNVGLFNLMANKPSEALAFFRQAADRAQQLRPAVTKELWFHMGVAHLRSNNLDDAKASLRNGLRPAQEEKDWGRMVSALDALAQIEQQQGNAAVAKKLLADAIGFAEKGNLRDVRKDLKRKLEAIA